MALRAAFSLHAGCECRVLESHRYYRWVGYKRDSSDSSDTWQREIRRDEVQQSGN
jgi:hypothetical protein